jgi:hypothetical protein
MRKNALYFGMLIVAGVIVALFLFPYLRDIGHPAVAYAAFAVLVLMAVYGRHH